MSKFKIYFIITMIIFSFFREKKKKKKRLSYSCVHLDIDSLYI